MMVDSLDLIHRIHIFSADTSGGIGPKMPKYSPAKKVRTKLEKLVHKNALPTIEEGFEKTKLGTIRENEEATFVPERVKLTYRWAGHSKIFGRIYPPKTGAEDPIIAADRRAGEMLEDLSVLLADDQLQRRELSLFFKANPALIGKEGSLQEKLAPLQELAADLGCGLQKTMQILNIYSSVYPSGSKISSKPPKPKGLGREDRAVLLLEADKRDVQAIKLEKIDGWLKAGGGPSLKYVFDPASFRGATHVEMNAKIDRVYKEACYEMMQIGDEKASTKKTVGSKPAVIDKESASIKDDDWVVIAHFGAK